MSVMFNKHISSIVFHHSDCGCILSESRGRYLAFDIIELAMEVGYTNEYVETIVDLFSDDVVLTKDDVEYDSARDYLTDVWEWIYESEDSAISWMNENASLPIGCMFTRDEHSGDFGMYYYGVTYEMIKESNVFICNPEQLALINEIIEHGIIGSDEDSYESECLICLDSEYGVLGGEYLTIAEILDIALSWKNRDNTDFDTYEPSEASKRNIRTELGNVIDVVPVVKDTLQKTGGV